MSADENDVRSIEDWVREILVACRADPDLWRKLKAGTDPWNLSASDLVAPANRLVKLLLDYHREAAAKERERCARLMQDWVGERFGRGGEAAADAVRNGPRADDGVDRV